jgi:hypothetical protein
MPHDDTFPNMEPYGCMRSWLPFGLEDEAENHQTTCLPNLGVGSPGNPSHGYNSCCPSPLPGCYTVCVKGPWITEFGGGDCVDGSNPDSTGHCFVVGEDIDLVDGCNATRNLSYCTTDCDPPCLDYNIRIGNSTFTYPITPCGRKFDIYGGNSAIPGGGIPDCVCDAPFGECCHSGGGDVVFNYVFTFGCDVSHMLISGSLNGFYSWNDGMAHPQFGIPEFSADHVFFTNHPITSHSGESQSIRGGAGYLEVPQVGIHIYPSDPVGPYPSSPPNGCGWKEGQIMGCGDGWESFPNHADEQCCFEMIAPNGYRHTNQLIDGFCGGMEIRKCMQESDMCNSPTEPDGFCIGEPEPCCCTAGLCEGPDWLGIIEASGVNEGIDGPGPALIDVSDWAGRAVILSFVWGAWIRETCAQQIGAYGCNHDPQVCHGDASGPADFGPGTFGLRIDVI